MTADYATAEALNKLADAVLKLGNGNAATEMGGLEALGVIFKDGFIEIANALDGISTHLESMTEVILVSFDTDEDP